MDFYINPSGSNLNSGSTEATASAVTSTNGSWSANRFTAASGTPFSGVQVGDWASIYLDGAVATPYIAQITTVTGSYIELSSTVKLGTAPTTGATGRSCKVGGAWQNLNAPVLTGTVPVAFDIHLAKATYTGDFITVLAGTVSAPLTWLGNDSTISGSLKITGAHNTVKDLNLTGSTSATFWTTATCTTLYNVHSENTGTGLAFSGYVNSNCTDCYFKGDFNSGGNVFWLIGCTIDGNVITTGNQFSLFHCILKSFSSTNGWGTIANCSFHEGGIVVSNAPVNNLFIINCHFENVSIAINNTSGTNTNLIKAIACSYFNCDTNHSGIYTLLDNGTIASTGYTEDYSPRAVIQGIGFPKPMDTGAKQHNNILLIKRS